MRLNQIILACLTLTLSTINFAFFCPTNFTQIDYGYTPDQVLQQCGKPDTQETKEVKNEGPQEWTYYIPQAIATGTPYQLQGTLKTTVAFDSNGKVVNISVNGIGIGGTPICHNTNIQLGDSRDKVKAACGQPSFINMQSNPALPQPPPTQITTFIYNTSPPVTLIFENGKLKEKK